MDRHQQVEELFHAALERASGERATFLAQECGSDLSLLAEVRALEQGPAGQAALKPGDRITHVQGRSVVDTEDVLRLTRKLQSGVRIKLTVQRAKGDTEPLELTVKLQACTDKKCLLPATVKVSVP